jgi:hypothetical protein
LAGALPERKVVCLEGSCGSAALSFATLLRDVGGLFGTGKDGHDLRWSDEVGRHTEARSGSCRRPS